MTKRTQHTAVYEPSGEPGWWTVTIAGVPGAISQGRSIAQARARITEALALILDVDEKAVELRDELRLGRDVQRAIDAYRKRREVAEREAGAASDAHRAAVRALLEAGMSTRDAGEALGVSQARIAQLAAEAEAQHGEHKRQKRSSGGRSRAA